jgi:hypothetical protein
MASVLALKGAMLDETSADVLLSYAIAFKKPSKTACFFRFVG